MNKKIILVFGIVFLLVTTGCKSGSKDKNPITDADVRKGIDGLTIVFLPNAPPASVFEYSTFPVGVELKNKGASNIENGLLVFGLEKAYVDGAKDEDKEVKPINIDGKSIFNPAGDEELIKVNVQAKTVGPQSETHPSTILATACYPYETVFGSSVCVDPDIYGEKKVQKVCKVSDVEFSEGQGAPVAITKVETRMLYADENTVRPQFIIYIENKGNGAVVIKDKFANACLKEERLEYEEFSKIKVDASLSGASLKCDPAEIRLKEKKGTARCNSEINIPKNRDAYTAPLEIKLDYGYTFTIPKDIVIEKI